MSYLEYSAIIFSLKINNLLFLSRPSKMLRREAVQIFLLVVAALTITIEIIGFFSPGWLCLSAKYLMVSQDANKIPWADDINDLSDTSGDNRVRRQQATLPPSRKPSRQDSSNSDSNRWRNNRTSVPSARQEMTVFRDFLRWTRKSNLTEVKSVPRNLTEFKKWIYKDKNTFIIVKGYLDQFRKDGQNSSLVYFQVIQYWLRGGADDLNHPNVLEDLPHANNNADINEYQKAMIYKEFKSFINRTVQQELPKDYNGFIKWLAKDTDRIKKVESRYDYFNKMIFTRYPPDKVDLYETVIETWFDQALKYNKSTDGNSGVWFDPSALIGNIEVKIRLGLWYGRECFQNQCSSTDASKLQENGVDVGGVATWNDLRVETIFALCAGAIGFVGTLLTVKPFCLKGRQRVTTIIGVSGLVLSCILFLVPITRVASINHSLKNSRMHENEVVQVDMPWAAAISGIGACLAFITAGFLVFFTWSDERQKWNKFKEDRTIVFKNNDKPRDERQASEDKDKAGSYDNVATMNDK